MTGYRAGYKKLARNPEINLQRTTYECHRGEGCRWISGLIILNKQLDRNQLPKQKTYKCQRVFALVVIASYNIQIGATYELYWRWGGTRWGGTRWEETRWEETS